MNDRDWLLQQREDMHDLMEGKKTAEEILSRVLRDLKTLDEAKQEASSEHPLLPWSPSYHADLEG